MVPELGRKDGALRSEEGNGWPTLLLTHTHSRPETLDFVSVLLSPCLCVWGVHRGEEGVEELHILLSHDG